MFSLGKLLVLGLMISAVCLVYRWVRRVDQVRASHSQARAAKAQALPAAEDMVKCSVCGVYRPARGGGRCDRPACPGSGDW